MLDRFTDGLRASGHDVEVADLYAEGFDPVFNTYDGAFFADDTVPDSVLEGMQLEERAIRSAGGPIRRAIARRYLRGRGVRELAQMVYARRPKDVLREQARVRAADGLAFIAPVWWFGFPAILKGWIERVFTHGFAYRLTAEGWQGDRPREDPPAPAPQGPAHQHDVLCRRRLRGRREGRDGAAHRFVGLPLPGHPHGRTQVLLGGAERHAGDEAALPRGSGAVGASIRRVRQV